MRKGSQVPTLGAVYPALVLAKLVATPVAHVPLALVMTWVRERVTTD